jgi:hypothetical protein
MLTNWCKLKPHAVGVEREDDRHYLHKQCSGYVRLRLSYILLDCDKSGVKVLPGISSLCVSRLGVLFKINVHARAVHIYIDR